MPDRLNQSTSKFMSEHVLQAANLISLVRTGYWRFAEKEPINRWLIKFRFHQAVRHEVGAKFGCPLRVTLDHHIRKSVVGCAREGGATNAAVRQAQDPI